ncbi:hypothetical protein HYZ97_01835 [Candidatus Pacearchaeota archaeon]|nr:hypothetical protein [Candidatus Pacearchaeota archaeon]
MKREVPNRFRGAEVLTLLLLFIGVLFFIFPGSPTGNFIADIQTEYDSGEQIAGTLYLMLKAGELIPADAIVKATLGSQEQTVALSAFTSEALESGTYYAEGTSLSGSGDGYGILGQKVTHPEIEFELLVTALPSDEDDSGEEDNSTEDEGDAEEGDDNDNDSNNESTDDSDTDKEKKDKEDKEKKNKKGSSITGNVISETEMVSGSVNKDLPYTFSLETGQTISLVSGSVMLTGASVDDSLISVVQNQNEVVVSTSYEVSESGFGEEYLGDPASTITFDLSELNMSAEAGTLRVSLLYGSTILSQASAEITITDAILDQNLNQTNSTQANESVNSTNASTEPASDSQAEESQEEEESSSSSEESTESTTSAETEELSNEGEENQDNDNIESADSSASELPSDAIPSVPSSGSLIVLLQPVLLKNIPTFTLSPGKTTEINLSLFFSGSESYNLTLLNVSWDVRDDTLVVIPLDSFAGGLGRISAFAANGTARKDSNEFTVSILREEDSRNPVLTALLSRITSTPGYKKKLLIAGIAGVALLLLGFMRYRKKN